MVSQKTSIVPLLFFRSFLLLVCISLLAENADAQRATSFSSKSLSGWSSANPHYWKIEKNVIVGHSEQKIPRNEFLWSETEVSDFYLSVDVLLDPNDCNAGIQFRSRKADSTGQAIGYQADIGKDVWARLYHEHGRGKLDWSDRGEKAVKPGKWNRYEILAVGDRIWTAVNGQLAVSVRDPGGEKSGYIALQIHSGPPQTVKYKINKLIHNPEVRLAGLDETRLNQELKDPIASAKPRRSPMLENKKVLALAGGTNIASMRSDGYLETLLYASAEKGFRVWNLGWDGDTVFEQFRDVGFGGLDKNLDSLGVDVLLMQFGQLESLEGKAAVPHFTKAFREMISGIQQTGIEIVLLSPVSFEPGRLFNGIDNPLADADIQDYVKAIAELAAEAGCQYIDIYTQVQQHPSAGNLTLDGIHLSPYGQKVVAEMIARELIGTDILYSERLEPVRQEVITKNYLWSSYWKPGNWAFLYGDRTTQPFSHDWQDKTKRIFPEEVRRFEPMILEAERRIVGQSSKVGLKK